MRARNWTRDTEEQLVATLDRQAQDTLAVREHFRRNVSSVCLAALELPEDGVRCVYFIASCGRIKIGKTEIVRTRIQDIQVPEKPILLALESGYTQREAELHRTFATLRTYGEWFMPGKDLLTYILEIRKRGDWWTNAAKSPRRTAYFKWERRSDEDREKEDREEQEAKRRAT